MTHQNQQPWRADIRKEIRFAAVLYGGVSLAVYISGVVRELLAMVRATTPGSRVGDGGREVAMYEPDVTGSMAVYRDLAAKLNAPEGEAATNVVYTRVVVDVISGTSAGGLNGIYLAKALAEGMSLDGLRKFWLDKGDIVGLLDAKNSSPRSVLSGGSMLSWLHEAFRRMEPIPNRTSEGGLVDDVNCYATTTDLVGLPIFLKHADASVVEQRHKNVYHFAFSSGTWGQPRNDFRDNDTSLAFASRCTSSFPAAFAPARLADLEIGLDAEHQGRLFPDYVKPPDADASVSPDPFDPVKRAFADGGILNNKPFVHAVNALGSRRGGSPSERKLIYVEPSPQPPLLTSDGTSTRDLSQPAFIDVITKSFSLPREQTIREELRRIDDRNRLIDRMNGILADIPHEVRTYSALVVENLRAQKDDASGERLKSVERLLAIADPSGRNAALRASDAFIASDVHDMVQIFGLGYAGYHRIKVASVTDDVTSLMAKLMSIPDESDDWRAVRLMIRVWRDITFAPYLTENETTSEKVRRAKLSALVPARKATAAAREQLTAPLSENAFLVRFDLRFGMRRLDFLLNKIDDLFCMDDRAATLLRSCGVEDADNWMNPTRRKELSRIADGLGTVYTMLRARLDSLGEVDAKKSAFSLDEWESRFEYGVDLDPARAEPLPPRDLDSRSSRLPELIAALRIPARKRQRLLTVPVDEQEGRAARTVAVRFAKFVEVANELARLNVQASAFARRWSTAILPVSPPTDKEKLEEPGEIIRFLYDHYEAVDRITFPVFYQTDVGQETDVVSLLRVSPDDAVGITNYVDHKKQGAVEHKLGGETFGHFGGFFSRQWRASDFLWGQLDAAERLIPAVAAGSKQLSAKEVNDFIERAQIAILSREGVEGIPQLEKLTDGRARLDFLRRDWRKLTASPPGMSETTGEAVSKGLPVLSRIVRTDGSGVGFLGPVIFLARSTYELPRKVVVFVLIGALMLAGAASVYSGFVAADPGPPWNVGRVLHYASVSGRMLGGVVLIAIGGVIYYVRRRLRKAIADLRGNAH